MNTNRIERFDHQGRGITYINKKIAFVENALPGEEVELRIDRENSKIIEATATKIIEKSFDRTVSICSHCKFCGGCNLLHINYDKQLEFKKNKVKQIMEKYANISEDKIREIVASPETINYRNKITLKVHSKIGYYKRKSNEIVYINHCYLANEQINCTIKKINEFGKIEGINEIVIRSFDDSNISLTIYLQKAKNNTKFTDYMNEFVTNITAYFNNNIIYTNKKSNNIVRLDRIKYDISSTAFFQVNTLQTINLYNRIKECISKYSNPNVLDLYCGVGSISLYISDICKSVLGVEINKEAIKDAIKNQEMNKINNASFIAGDTKKVLSMNSYKADIIIVDPPRSGLDKEVITDLININPNQIIYVSCDPLTAARDIKLLSLKYEVTEITPFDMFPNTYHVECVSVLHRKTIEE